MKKLSLLLTIALAAPLLSQARSTSEAPLNCEVVSVIQGQRAALEMTSLAVSHGDDPYRSIPALRKTITTQSPYQRVQGTIELKRFGEIRARIAVNNNGQRINHSESNNLSDVRSEIRKKGSAQLAFTGYGYIVCK